MPFKCPKCKTTRERIGVVSECTQTYNVSSNEYNNTEVGDTIRGFCLECAEPISPKKLKKLLGE